jgi:hypothetical protein
MQHIVVRQHSLIVDVCCSALFSEAVSIKRQMSLASNEKEIESTENKK